MRRLLLSATIVALSVNLATNLSYAQTINPQGTTLNITTDVTGQTGQGEGGAYHNSGTMTVGGQDGQAVNVTGNSVTAGGGYGGYGGAIWSGDGNDPQGQPLEAKSSLTIYDNVTFSNNTANFAGGALSLNGGLKTAIHNNVTFSGNQATDAESYGGAIYITTTRDEINLEIGQSVQFNQNTAGSGGAIYSNDAQISIDNEAIFSGNKALAGSGGAIYSWDSNVQASKGVVTVGEEATFDQNEAAWSGGAIFNTDGKVSVGQGAQFTTNKALDGNGGAIANNVSVGTVKDTQLNIAGNTTFSGNSVKSTSDGYGRGGAIYNAGTLNIDSTAGNVTFQNNTASDTGKDVYLTDNSVMNITGSNTVSFQSGEGAIAGTGAINKTGTGTFELVNSDISSSYTGTYTQEAGTLSLDGSTMSNNFQINDGNLVLRNGSKLFLSENGKIANGTITVGDSITRAAGDASVLTLKNGGQIASVVDLILRANNEVVIETDSTAVYGGQGGDLWAGKVTLSGGTLNYEGLDTNGQLIATSGTLNINNGTLNVAGADSTTGASSISGDVTVNINSNTTMAIGDNGSATINSDDSWSGNINMTGGQLDYSLNSNGKLTASAGKLNITGADSLLTLQNGSSISGTTVTKVTNGTLSVGNNGSISGGTNTFDNGELEVTNGGNISGGENTFNNGSSLTVSNGGTVSGGTNAINSGSSITVEEGGRVTGGTTTVASGATFDNAGIISDNADIDIATNDATNSGTISGGTVDIANGGALENSGTISGGTTTIANGGSVTVTADGEITGGTVDAQSGSTFNNSGTISDNADIDIATNNATNSGTISGGTVDIANGGALENSGTISGGTTTIANGGSVTVTADGEITGGTVDVSGTLNNDGNIKGTTNLTVNQNGEIIVGNNAVIDTTGAIEIATGGKLTINEGGEATLKEDDIWSGTIVNENGTLTLVDRNDSGKDYSQTGGELVLDGTSFELGGTITGGQVTVSDGSNFDILDGASMTGGDVVFVGTGNTVNVDGEVTADAEYEINNNNTINIKENGSFVANNNDIWTDGKITVNGGKLDFQGTVDEDSTPANGILQANEGEVDINSDFTMINGSYIAAAVDTDINQDTTLNSGSSLELNTDDTWASDATITIDGGKLTYDDLTSNGHIDANSGELAVNSGTLTVDNQSDIAGDVTTTIGQDATVDITGGKVSLNNNDSWEGELTINGGSLEYAMQENGKIQANTGELNIVEGGTLTMVDTNDVIEDAVETTINGTLNVQNGNATLNDNDIWTGVVHVSDDGTLNLNNVVNGTLIADGGTLNFQNGELNITGDSIITGDAATNLTEGTVNINNGTNGGGSVTVNDSDNWGSDVTVNLGQGGKLDYDLTSNGTLKADGGQLTTQDDSKLTLNGDSYINKEVTANLAGDTTIQSGATVDLGNDGTTAAGGNDILTGDVTIDNGGTLNLFNDVAMKDPVAGGISQSIAVNGTMNLETTGVLHLNADLSGGGDINKNGEGDVWFHGQNGAYTGTILVDNGGDLLFENGLAGNLVFGDIDGETIGIHADEITGDLTQDREATIMYTTYHDDVDLDLNGNIDVSKGTLIAESKGDKNINFGGTVNVNAAADAQNPVSMNANSNGAITFNNTVTANNSTLNVGSVLGTTFNNDTTLTNSILNATSGDLNFNNLVFADSASIVNSMNGAINDNTVANLDMNASGQANFQIDVSTRDWDSDSFNLSQIAAANGGKINISDWQFVGKAPIDRFIKVDVFDVNNVDPTLLGNIEFTQTDKQIFTPIGWYQLFNQTKINPATGMPEVMPGSLQAQLVKYNPQVFRGQVATVASYANQLVTNNIVFDHIFNVSNQLLAEKNPNKYAAAYPQFAPYQYSRKDGSLWFKTYGTLEHIDMTNGLDVENNAYGALVGADFPVIEMKKGWSFLPTAYVGYNGAHQTFDGVGMYQNGGQLGAMGTFMKNDFLGSVMLYGGGYGNQMDVAGYHDHTGNWFVGTAAKAAYNFHPTKHFTIQPTLLASYNYFHSQNWYTQFGDMNMNAGKLNGVNVAPGLNLIYGRETWSIYATIQYMFNILGTSSGNAGNVVLEDIRMKRSYIEYGIGATKTWKDRFSAYLQITVRNVARTGIGFQGGVTFKF